MAGGRVITEEESKRYVDAEHKRAVRKKWARRSLFLAPLALIGIVLFFVLRSSTPVPFPTGSTNATSLSTPGEWTMGGFDLAHTRDVPENFPALKGQQIWSTNLGGPFLNSPVVADDLAYFVNGDGLLVAVDRTTGAIRWQRQVDAPADSAASVAGDTLFVGLRNRNLLALNKDTGEVLWTYQADGAIAASPTVVKGVVYSGSSSGDNLFALDVATGQELWTTGLDERLFSAAMSWDENNMVLAAGDKVIYYDRRSRQRTFTFTSLVGNAVGSPVVIGDSVYTILGPGGVLALELGVTSSVWEKPIRRVWGQLWIWGMAPRPPQPTGLLWHYAIGDAVIAPPAAKGNLLYFGTVHGDITALNIDTQQPVWTFAGDGAVRGAPAVVGDTLYVGSGRYLYALNANTGQKLWEFQANAEVDSDIVVTREAVYFADAESNVYAVN